MIASRRWRLVLPVAALALGLAHLGWWYLPRERPGMPGKGLPSAVFADPAFAVRLWLPHPHQNLAAWERSSGGELEEWSAALARLVGEESPSSRLPAFGPFRVPPSSELAVAWGEPGLRVAARIHPSWMLIGRLGGWLAGNPWLAGGEVELAGRPARVRWVGRSWLVETAAGAAPQVGAEGGRREEALLWLSVASELLPGALPQQVEAAIRRSEAGLELAGAEGGTLGGALDRGWQLLPEVDVVLVGQPEGVDARSLLALRGGGAGVGGVELPGAFVVTPVGEARWNLPAERLARRLGLDLERDEVEGLELVALDRASLERARARVAAGRTLLDDPALRLGLWLRPAELWQVADTLADGLEAIPLLFESEARWWRDLERVLRPLSGFPRAGLVVGTDGVLLGRLERPAD